MEEKNVEEKEVQSNLVEENVKENTEHREPLTQACDSSSKSQNPSIPKELSPPEFYSCEICLKDITNYDLLRRNQVCMYHDYENLNWNMILTKHD